MRSPDALRAWIAPIVARLSPTGRWLRLAAIAVLVAAQLASTAWAGTFTVTSTTDNGLGNVSGTLSYAITQANANPGSTIVFSLPSGQTTVTLSGPLTPIEANVTINGQNVPGLTINGGNTSAAFFVDSGTVTIENLTIAHANAVGGAGGYGWAGGGGGLGAGGALFVNSSASVTVQNVAFQNNSATGGAGGAGNSSYNDAGGGGGGFHGAGGNAPGNGIHVNAGGGGGGFVGHGGTGSTYGGGGGGGEFGNGASGGREGGGGGGGTNSGQNGAAGGSTSGGSGGGASGGAGGTAGSSSAPPTAGTTGGGGGGGGYLSDVPGSNPPVVAAAGNGGKYGGGGGGAFSGGGSGNGGDFGGGGGSGYSGVTGGGTGGFGGGGGGGAGPSASPLPGGAGGFGGGHGGALYTGGNGGSAYGGAVFVRSGGTLTVIDSDVSGSSITAGSGGLGSTANGIAGAADGTGMYLMTGTTNTFQVNSSQTETISDQIGGAGGLTKTGAGTLTLSGASDYTGATEVTAGIFNLTGSITSSTTVDSGGTLSGSGAVTGNVVNNGTVNLDPSVLTVNGNYTQNSGGVLKLDINSPGANTTTATPGVNNSELVVNGNATVGGILEIVVAPGTYKAGTVFDLLAVSGSHTFNFTTQVVNLSPGTFNVVDPPSGGYELIDLSFTQNVVVYPLGDFAGYAATPNQLAVANFIDPNESNPNSAWQNLITTLESLSSTGLRGALDQMSGAIYGSVAQTDFQSTTIELSFISRRIAGGLSGMGGASGGVATNSYGNKINASSLAASDANLVIRGQNVYAPFMPQGRWTTWGFGYGLGGNAQGTSNAAGLNYSLGGTVAGLEMRDDNHLIGGYAGYVGSHLGSYLAGQSINVNGGQMGIYLRGDDGKNYYIVLGGMGADGYNSHRLMQFGGINTTAFANYGGWQSQAYFERGITLENESVSIQPYAALQYLYVRQNSFTETNAGAMDLKVAGIDANSLRSLIGIRLAGNAGLSAWGGKITPVARALWLHEFLSTNTGLNAQFAPIGGTSFAVTGTSLGRDWAILGTGLNWNIGRGWQAYANYDAQVNVVQTFHVGSGGFQYSW